MSKEISLFPMLNREIQNRVYIKVENYDIYYSDGYEQVILSYDPNSNIISFEENNWNPEENNLILKATMEISKVSQLFGEEGIACKDSVIGVGLLWHSKTSNQRGVYEVGTIELKDDSIKANIEKIFDKGQLRGRVTLELILYIKKSGNPDNTEFHLANEEGYILGTIVEKEISIDGEGSTFPIYEIEDKKQLLWDVELKWEDPEVDKFVESISININKKHKDFIFLDRNSKKYNKNMLNEIVSSSLLLLILKLKEDDNLPEGDTSYEEGSILEAVSYFKQNMDIDFTTSATISKTIRNHFNKLEGVNDVND